MRLRIEHADRASLAALLLATLANWLFLLTFLLVAAMVASRAEASSAGCNGKDLVKTLERENPALLARVRAEAAGIPNGKGLLWRVEREGAPPSHLFGTMHVTDPKVLSLGSAVQQAFDSSRTVVIETTDLLDHGRMMAALMREPELMMFTDDRTLQSMLPPEDAGLFSEALKARGIPPASVAKMKPWMISSMLALPACELARKAEGQDVLDVKLARDAEAAGKEVAGLETVAEQLRAFSSLPMDFHLRGLVSMLRLGERMDDLRETLIGLYLVGEVSTVVPLFEAILADEGDAGLDYVEFEEVLVSSRNRTMAERAMPLLERGGAFIAVGALHLPGPEGLVELLRQRGFAVTAVE